MIHKGPWGDKGTLVQINVEENDSKNDLRSENWCRDWFTPERCQNTVCQRGAAWRDVQINVCKGGHVTRQLWGDRRRRLGGSSGE